MKAKNVFTIMGLSFAMGVAALFGRTFVPKEEPVRSEALAAGDTIYLQPNANWKQASAKFAVYTWKGTDSNQTWTMMSVDADESNYYSAVLPANAEKAILCRMDPSTTSETAGWGKKWNQTGDLVLSESSGNIYKITDGAWDNDGSWDGRTYKGTDVPASDGYYIVGSQSSWTFTNAPKMDAGDAQNNAILEGYQTVAHEEFKVRQKDGNYTQWLGGDNVKVDEITTGSTGKITIYMSKDGNIYTTPYEDPVDPTTIKYYVKIAAGEFNLMTYVDSFVYDETKTGYRFKLEGVDVAHADDKVFFRKGDSETIKPGASRVRDDHDNNLYWKASDESISVLEACEDQTLYLYVYESGYDSFMGGYTPSLSTYYFTNNQGWAGTPKVYLIDRNVEGKTAWPGDDMVFVDYDGDNNARYSFAADTALYPSFVIANSDGSDQTVDLTFATYVSTNGFYLNERDSEHENHWTVGVYTYVAADREIWIDGTGHDLTLSAVQPVEEHLVAQYESAAIELEHNDSIVYKIDNVIKTFALEQYGLNNAKIVNDESLVLADATAKVYVKQMDDGSNKVFVGGIHSLSKGYHVFLNEQEIIELKDSGEVPEGFTGQTYSEAITFHKNDSFRLINTNLDDSLPVPFSPARFDEYSIKGFGLDEGFVKYTGESDIEAAIYLKLKAGDDMIYVGETTPELKNAKLFAIAFNDAVSSECSSKEKTEESLRLVWQAQVTAFGALEKDSQDILKAATTSHSVKEIADFIAKYEYVAGKYKGKLGEGYNFLDKTLQSINMGDEIASFNSNNAMLFAIVGAISLVALASVIVLKKKKANR